jgi:hypothetical protein
MMESLGCWPLTMDSHGMLKDGKVWARFCGGFGEGTRFAEALSGEAEVLKPADWSTMTEGEKNAELDQIFGEDSNPQAAAQSEAGGAAVGAQKVGRAGENQQGKPEATAEVAPIRRREMFKMRYPKLKEGPLLARGNRAPKIGTYSPPPRYRVRRSKAPKPGASSAAAMKDKH